MVSVGKGILNSEVIKNTAARIRKMNDGRVPDPSLEFITCSAALAPHGLLGAVDYVTLVDVDRNKLVDLRPEYSPRTSSCLTNLQCD